MYFSIVKDGTIRKSVVNVIGVPLFVTENLIT